MPNAATPWALEEFLERLDAWSDIEALSVDLKFIVISWVLSRFDDPYQGARRQPEIPGLWFAQVPGSREGDHAIFCSYWIDESTHTVRCDAFARLGLPA